ncbi:hypothetical protein SBOR_10135 [Sclerotinia borealis F-4128]|uniref:Uncharacterized protein n=1 Tax=Sclerotinia borealis (strain F-4128) TaxID=1432307 RepID=W9C4I7_SCLBF|nr:hypothetical protein SBOR_10135 [Sclerotinia borealis F-4128]
MEKAEVLRTEILDRFSAEDDLEYDPLGDQWEGSRHLPWNSRLTLEEVEASVIGVSSTSPGTDQVTEKGHDIRKVMETHYSALLYRKRPGKNNRQTTRLDSPEARHYQPPTQQSPTQTLHNGPGSVFHTRCGNSTSGREESDHSHHGRTRRLRRTAQKTTPC